MPWSSSAWAIDGARTPAARAREALYEATGGAEGVVGRNDLKVSATSPTGGRVMIANGGALVRNRSAGGSGQTYSVNRDGDPTLDYALIDSQGAGSSRTDLVVALVEDPQYAPWPKPAAGTEADYQYVKTRVIKNVPAGTLRFKELIDSGFIAVPYSAVELAKVTLPANTVAVTAAMITDLRTVAIPRTQVDLDHKVANAADNLNPGGASPTINVFELFPNGVFIDVFVPDWAVTAKVSGFVEGLRLTKAGIGALRIAFADGGATTNTNVNESAPSAGNNDRRSYNVGGNIAVPDNYRGTTRRLRWEGTIKTTASSGFLATDENSSGQIQVRFEEKAV